MTLKLTLKKRWFDIMLSGEKNIEFRNPSKWIYSRLYNKDGTEKKYDKIRFTNGYGNDRPFFECVFCGFAISNGRKYTYSIGSITPTDGSFMIFLGAVLSSGNLKT